MPRVTSKLGDMGIECDCGHFSPFTAWVLAHMNVAIMFTCQKCDKKWRVLPDEKTMTEAK